MDKICFSCKPSVWQTYDLISDQCDNIFYYDSPQASLIEPQRQLFPHILCQL